MTIYDGNIYFLRADVDVTAANVMAKDLMWDVHFLTLPINAPNRRLLCGNVDMWSRLAQGLQSLCRHSQRGMTPKFLKVDCRMGATAKQIKS